MVLVLNMDKDLTINFKDALFLLNVHFLIGPKKWSVSYQLLAFIVHTDALAFLNAKDSLDLTIKDRKPCQVVSGA